MPDPDCQRCRLHQTSGGVCISGRGLSKARIMIIDEAPSPKFMEGGPFTGRRGELLGRLLTEEGFKLNRFYYTHAVHCQAIEGKSPTKGEIKACHPWLIEEIEKVNPQYILLLGNTPLLSLTGQAGIQKRRGKAFKWEGRIVLPMYQPSYLLYDDKQMPIARADIKQLRRIVDFGGIPYERGVNLRLILKEKDMREAEKDLADSALVSWDLETNGLSMWQDDSEIVTFGLGTRDNQWVLPLFHSESPWGRSLHRKLVQRMLSSCEDADIVAHNGKFDSKWLYAMYGIKLYPQEDTMLAHYLLDENSRHGLKDLATRYFNAPNYDIDVAAKQGEAPLEKTAFYHAHDLYYTRKLGLRLRSELKKDRGVYTVYKRLLMPANNVFIDAECHGVFIDQPQMKAAGKVLRGNYNQAKKELDKYGEINWGSPSQVGKLLFDDLGIDPLDLTDSGNPSTSESVLLRLAEKHPVAKHLLDFRAAKQQLSHFIDGWEPHLVDSRLHPTFKLHGTVTGRLSCADPNLQQVPRDKRIRSLITAPPGYTFVEADLSQVELRIAAELSGDSEMLQAFQSGIDVHWKTLIGEIRRSQSHRDLAMKTAKRLTNQSVGTLNQALDVLIEKGPDAAVQVEEAWKELRKKAKAINFGYLYGMWWKKFVTYARDSYGVTITDAEARDSRSSFFDNYRGLSPWHDRQKKYVRNQGYVRSLAGRKRRLPAALGNPDTQESRAAERQAINSPVQSFASDLNLMAAIELRERWEWDELRIVGAVHDALLFEVRNDVLAEAAKDIEATMSHPQLLEAFNVNLTVPLEADVEIGPWGKGVSPDRYFSLKA